MSMRITNSIMNNNTKNNIKESFHCSLFNR